MEEYLQKFQKGYWEYYLDLEEQLLATRRFVAFDEKNEKTFSMEYLKLYQAVCSEIDVVGKEMAFFANPNFQTKDTNIKKWGYEIQQKFPSLKDSLVIFNDLKTIQPFKDWEYEISISKQGRKNIKIKNDKKTIQWWKHYNDVKHKRVGLLEEENNFYLANQKNLVEAFSALYLLETVYIKELDPNGKDLESKLFKTKK